MVSSRRSSSPPPPPPPPRPRTTKMPKSFLDLPAEIRNSIYEETLPKTKTVYIWNGQTIVHPLLLVSRQIRHEYHPHHEAHVDAAEWVEADVLNWDFRHVNKFFDTTCFHQLGDMPKLKIRLVLDDPAVIFDQGSAGAAFEHWFSKPYKVPYIVPHRWSNPYSGGGSSILPGRSSLFSNGGSSLFSNGGSSLFPNRASSLFSIGANLRLSNAGSTQFATAGSPTLFNGGGSTLFSNGSATTTLATAGSPFLPNGGGYDLYSNGGNTPSSNGRPLILATAGSPFLPNGGGYDLYSNGGNTPFSNGRPVTVATAGSPMLPNAGGSNRYSNGGNLPSSNGGDSSLFSGGGSTLFGNNGGVDLIINYDLQVDWNKYDTTSLERLLDQIKDWFRQRGTSIYTRPSAGWGLREAMRQTLETRREWMHLEAYKRFQMNSRPTRWPGIDDGIENDVEMMDAP